MNSHCLSRSELRLRALRRPFKNQTPAQQCRGAGADFKHTIVAIILWLVWFYG